MEATAAERYASGGPGRDLYAQNLALAFQATVDRIGDDPAIRAGHGDDEPVITWNELRDQVGRIAGGLASLGVSKGDTVAIMLNNRPEFIPIDMAAVSLGAVPFSIYQTSSPEQIEYVVVRRGRQGRDRRAGVPRGVRKGAREPAADRDADRRRRRGWRPHAGRARGDRPRLRHLRVGRRGRARRPAHPDLHLRDDRTAEGRPADPPQPDDPDRRRSRTSSTSPTAAPR